MVADNLVDDEADELLAEIGIEMRFRRQCPKTGDLPFLPCRVACRQAALQQCRRWTRQSYPAAPRGLGRLEPGTRGADGTIRT